MGATWLSPIFKSPMVGKYMWNSWKPLEIDMNFQICLDFGYDISDYLSIQPEYGTMADFDELIVKAKELGSKIFYLPDPFFKFPFLSHTLHVLSQV